MFPDGWLEQLQSRLAQPLPGPMVGSRFESRPRFGRHYDQFPAQARRAAVLVLLYPWQAQWFLPLTVRPAHLPDHPGQIGLPGGAIEAGETSRQAAVREFHEELGATGLAIELLGALSSIYVHASNFRVEPWVAVAAQRPGWAPNPIEVEQLLEVPLAHLCDPVNLGSHQRDYQGQTYEAPHFAWQAHRVWGATCMILGELVTVLGELEVTGRL